MPRYLLTLTTDENALVGTPPPALHEAIGATAQAWGEAGILLDTGGLAPTAVGTRLRLDADEITAVGGPFIDAEEVTTAYAVVRASDQEAAVGYASAFLELHKKHWPGWEGGSEIRQIFGADDAGTGA